MAEETKRFFLGRIVKFGESFDEAQDTREQKSVLVIGSFMFIAVGAIWGIAYILFQEPLAGMIPLSYALISFLSLVYYSLTRSYRFFRTSQLFLILLSPFLLMLALGGFISSSAVILWSFLCPLGALLFSKYLEAPRWLLAYLGLLALSGFIQPYVNHPNNLPQGVVIAFFVFNIGTVSTIAFILLRYFVGKKEEAYHLLRVEQDRSESLLLNILPKEIAARLKGGEKTIADYHPMVSVLFADLSGFTPLSNQLSPNEMVKLLNQIYSYFDSLVEKYGIEKIRTIGDNYMVAAGVPNPRPDHADVLARAAIEMNTYISSLAPVNGKRLAFRIGINSGPVIAGVIGRKKFAYDVWGDTVNMASRMESQGVPGRIQITQATYNLIKEGFLCEFNGPVAIKGKGEMETWFLVSPNGGASRLVS